MKRHFHLFGEESFRSYALERFAGIRQEIENMNEIELLMYRDSFDELLQKMLATYAFRKLDINFDHQVVDLISRNTQHGKIIFAEYSVAVTGNTYYLGLMPSIGAGANLRLPVQLSKNVLSFEIDTCYADADLPIAIRAAVKAEYIRIKKFIVDSLYNLNETIKQYNEELERLLVLLLADRLRRAEKMRSIKESLNFT